MMAHVAVDIIHYVKHLEKAGFARNQAEALVEASSEIIGNTVATQHQLEQVEIGLNSKLQQVRSELKAEIQQVHSELKTEIQQVHSELKTEIQQVRSEIQQVRSELKADIEVTHQKIEQVRVESQRDLQIFRNDIIIKLGSFLGSLIIAATAILSVMIGVFH